MYTWYSFKDHTGSARWFAFMNFAVHSLMYSYYAIRSMNVVRIPKSIPFIITCAQLTQMVFGILIIFGSYVEKLSNRRCDQSYENLNLSLLMYASYFVLFVQYFHKSYYGSGKFATVSIANGQEKLKKIE
jgi:elongation of very long chain fatty acids protein 6